MRKDSGYGNILFCILSAVTWVCSHCENSLGLRFVHFFSGGYTLIKIAKNRNEKKLTDAVHSTTSLEKSRTYLWQCLKRSLSSAAPGQTAENQGQEIIVREVEVQNGTGCIT